MSDENRRRHEEEASKNDIVEFASWLLDGRPTISQAIRELERMLHAAHGRGVEQGMRSLRHLPTTNRGGVRHAIDGIDFLAESEPVAVDSFYE